MAPLPPVLVEGFAMAVGSRWMGKADQGPMRQTRHVLLLKKLDTLPLLHYCSAPYRLQSLQTGGMHRSNRAAVHGSIPRAL